MRTYQTRRTNQQTRATMIVNGLKDFIDDAEGQEAFYAIEYGRFAYDESFHGSEIERRVDKLLRLFSNIALLWDARLLSTKDVAPFSYYFLRVHRNDEVKKYLAFMADWTRTMQVSHHPYASFSRLCRALDGHAR